jgi:uncharacterized membrane protein YfhO
MMLFEKADDPNLKELPALIMLLWVVLTLIIIRYSPKEIISGVYVTWHVLSVVLMVIIDKTLQKRKKLQGRKDEEVSDVVE